MEEKGPKGIEKMVKKAKQMIREGRVTRIDRSTYQVVGDHGTYMVIKGADGSYHCGCQGFVTRGFCSHALAVYLLENRKRKVKEAKKEEKKEEEIEIKDILDFLQDEW